MKKYLIIASAALIALAACNKEPLVEEPTKNDGAAVLTFTSKRPELGTDTKTVWDNDSKSIFWSPGDKIKVGFTFNDAWWAQNAAYSPSNETPNNHIKFYQSGEVSIDLESSNDGTFTVPTGFEGPTTNGNFVFYAIYPYSLIDNNLDSAPSASITLKTNQSPVENSFDAATDIMVGSSKTISSTGLPTDPIDLEWKRVVAHAALTFTNMAFVGTETPNKITLTFNEAAKVAGSFSVNIADGTIGEGSANEIVLEGRGLTVDGTSINAWATVLPVSFSSLKVEIKTDKATYTRDITSFTGGAKTFKGNARNTLTINMDTADRTASAQYEWVKTELSEITASDVFVIVGNNGDTYAMSNDNGTGNPPAAVAVTVANDKLTAVPTDKLQWNLTKDESNYTFYPNGTTESWLYCTATNNGVRVGTNANKVFTLDSNSGYLKHTVTSRYVGIYNSQDWRCYTSNGGNIANQTFSFYVKTAAGPAITWNLESIAITTAPTKTVYTAGQSFDPAGMVVTGHFVDADDNTNTKDEAVTGYTFTPDGALSTSDDHVTITYQGKSVDQAITVNPAPAGNDGSLEHPYTASEARALALNGDTGSYYISGIVTKIQNQYSASFGTANFWIDENGTDQTVFEGYKIKYFGDVNWVEGNAEIALNDEVVIYGTLTVYTNNNNSTPETSSGYLVSLNGKTKGLTLAAPTVTTNDSAKQITVAWTAATGTESAVSYVINCGTQSYNANAAGSHTFTMADYGTYNVSVEATASDAVSATINTSAILTNPSSATPYYVKVTDLSTLSANDKVIVINMNHRALPAFTSTGTISESDISSAYDSTNDRFSVTSDVANCAITLKAPTTTVNGKTVFKLYMSNNNYITKSGTSGTGFNPATTSNDVGGDWTLSMDSNGRVNVKNNYSSSTRCLIWRAGSTNKFGAYASSNVNDSEYYNVYLYKLAN